MNTIIVWLLIATPSYSGAATPMPVVIERFADVQECDRVRHIIVNDLFQNVVGTKVTQMRCVRAVVVAPSR